MLKITSLSSRLKNLKENPTLREGINFFPSGKALYLRYSFPGYLGLNESAKSDRCYGFE